MLLLQYVLDELSLSHQKLMLLNKERPTKESAIALMKIDEAIICLELLIKKEGEKTHV